jgi:hypothetical protein
LKTDELIAALARDRKLAASPARLMVRTLPVAALTAFALLLLTLGLRPDLSEALTVPRFQFKLVVTLCLAIPALGLLPRMATPLPKTGVWKHALWLAPLVLFAGVLLELHALPGEHWVSAAVGHNAWWCLGSVPLLAAAPLAASLYCLRRSAPAEPVRAGAVAGLVSGGIAATIYALHCNDDSPLFVALWYTLGILLVTGVGAGLAARFARW